jgi:hypothetical protein
MCLCVDIGSVIVPFSNRNAVQNVHILPSVDIDDRIHNEQKEMKI